MATANDVRKGAAIKYGGEVCVVLDTQHRTPGNLRAFVQATIRNIKSGKSSLVRFASTEPIEIVPLIRRKLEFSYKDGNGYTFMDPENYETCVLQEDLVGDYKNYLVEGESVHSSASRTDRDSSDVREWNTCSITALFGRHIERGLGIRER